MKKFTVIIALAAFAAGATPVFAQKGANEKALEHASDQAIFNRVGDWFATIGKNKEEKARIKAERRVKRAAKNAEKKAKQAKDELEDDAEEAKEKIEKGSKKAAGDVERGAGVMKEKMGGRGPKK